MFLFTHFGHEGERLSELSGSKSIFVISKPQQFKERTHADIFKLNIHIKYTQIHDVFLHVNKEEFLGNRKK